MNEIPDVDIDVGDRTEALNVISNYKFASVFNNDILKHNTGLYFQNIKTFDNNISTIPYKEAEEYGYCKIDILQNNVYKHIKNQKHYDELLNNAESIYFNYHLFLNTKFYKNEEKLYQIGNHYDLVKKFLPNSVEDLAVLIALIRPGKTHLINKSWNEIKQLVWIRDDNDKYFFKKSHAIAFALVILIHIQILDEILV